MMSVSMDRLFIVLVTLTASVMAASAQALSGSPQENITVTATKSREILDKFAKAFTVPTKLTGKIARWESGICPVTVGQPAQLTASITQRVRDVATTVGAPVSSVKSCTPNVEIIFTTTPQALLDNVRKNDPDYLGYATTSAQQDALATVTRPVQAWYTTETIDLNGMRRVDSGRRLGTGITMSNFTALPCASCGSANRDPIYLPDATYARVTGNRISDGSRSGFNHVLIAIDSGKLAGRQFGPLTDYIAMLVLTQLNSLDTCQEVPSIVNMMATNCDQKVEGMTPTDLAYLRGLYQMDSGKSLLFQQNDIAVKMTDALDHGSVGATPAMEETRCIAPDQPSTIDGTTSTLDQLNHSISDAKSFMMNSDVYQDCLGAEIGAQKAAATPGKQAIAARNLALAAANQKMKENVGTSINSAIAAYKKAHPSP
jgi:hypothetical protein